MTKKHFIQLADVIRANPGDFTPESIRALASFCKSQNSQFNTERWYGYIKGSCGPSGGDIKRAKLAS